MSFATNELPLGPAFSSHFVYCSDYSAFCRILRRDMDETTALDTETIVQDATTRYFLIKSYNHDNLGRSLQHRVWATSQRNDRVFSAAYQTSSFVVLFFSVNHSSRFSGFAVMTSEPGGLPQMQGKSVFCGPDGSPFPGRLFGVHWVATAELFFRDCEHLSNAFNEGKPVKVGRDGQEIDPEAGRALAKLLDKKAEGKRCVLMVKSDGAEEGNTEDLSEAFNWEVPPKWSLSWLDETLNSSMKFAAFPLDLTEFKNYDEYLAKVTDSKDLLWRCTREGLCAPEDLFLLPPWLERFSQLPGFDVSVALLLLARSAPSAAAWHFKNQSSRCIPTGDMYPPGR